MFLKCGLAAVEVANCQRSPRFGERSPKALALSGEVGREIANFVCRTALIVGIDHRHKGGGRQGGRHHEGR